MEVVIAIAAKVAGCLVEPIGKQICYPLKYDSNMEELEKQVQKLTDQREMVQHRVDQATRQGEEIEKVVEDWLKSVDEFVEVAKPILEDEDKAGKLCSIGFCFNLMTRYSLSKKAEKTAEDGISLLEEGTFQTVSYRSIIQRTKFVYPRGYEDFESRMGVFEELMEALKDEDVNLIGVHGMGGVGKTTLVKRVAGQAMEDKLFDVVVMAEVAQSPDIRSLQGDIADELDLKFDKEGLPGRAAQLRERLKNETSILLILDNIWKKLDLDAVGIPFWNDEKSDVTQELYQRGRNANRRKWKLLLTSRDLDVLQNDMNTQKNFFVDTLSDGEAKNLFWKIVNHSKENVDFNSIAIEIVRKCAGLPIAITTIASALKSKDLSYWKNALQWLRRSNPKPIRGMEASVYATIELSYNVLGLEEQSLFLLCGLVKEGCHTNTNDLFKYSMGLSLFKEVDTMEDARNRMDVLINNLRAACLLVTDNVEGCFKMHDIIHAVAISIASSKDKLMFSIQNVTSIKEMLEDELPKDSVAVCDCRGDIEELPEMLEFSKLEFLHLYRKEISLKIPGAFFDGVKELKVLDLTCFDLSSLPSSLCRLRNLQTLCLDGCLIGDIAIIGELKKLEILSFMYSEIEQLPEEMRQLTRLRLLDLSRCSKLKVIKPNVLSSLTRLEELYMGNGFVQWDVDGQRNASLVELRKLSNLTTLEMQVLDAQIMPHDLLFGKLKRYRIFIGDQWKWLDKYRTRRMLKLKLNNSSFLSDGIKFLLNSVEDLHLDEPKGVKNVLQELNKEGFQQLKHLHIQNATQIQDISNSLGWGLFYVFPQRLESLVLHNLINVEKIYHDKLTIKVIKVEKCNKLKHLTLPMAGNLSQLQKIKVTHCNKLEVIAFEGNRQFHKSEQTSKIEFTELRTMTLQCLPCLTRFGVNMLTRNVGFEEIVAVDDPDSFIPFLNQNDLFPRLEKLKLSSINLECRWLDQLPAMSSSFRTLTKLTMEECGGLEFLFSYSMVKSLMQLRKLEIRNCKSMEAIISTEEFAGEERLVEMIFPKLSILGMFGLPKLTRIGSGNSIEFPSLRQLFIDDCPNLKTFVSRSMFETVIVSKEQEKTNSSTGLHPLYDKKVSMPSLGNLILKYIDSEVIWNNQFLAASSYLHNLNRLLIHDLCNLKYLLLSSMVNSLVQLKELEIIRCKLVEVVVVTEVERPSVVLFPILDHLHLEDLPKLTRFCNLTENLIDLPSLSTLCIKNCPTMKTFVSNSLRANMMGSTECCTMNSKDNLEADIQPFFDEKALLPRLENLTLSSIKIECAWLDQLPSMSSYYRTLVKLYMEELSGLKFLFPYSMVRGLVQLQELGVRNCKFMEAIINTEEFVGEERLVEMLFPKLSILRMERLPNLTRIVTGNSIEFPSLRELFITDCPNLKTFVSGSKCETVIVSKEQEKTNSCTGIHPLYDKKVSMPSLGNLMLKYINSEVIWNNQFPTASSYLHNLNCLHIHDLCNLKYLLLSSMVNSLVQLKELEIVRCKLMEVVVVTEVERPSVALFPILDHLHLEDLPKLIGFCDLIGNLIDLSSLSKLCIKKCPTMKTFISSSLRANMTASTECCTMNSEENLEADIQPFFDETVRLSNLKELNIEQMDNLRKVWHNQFYSDSFCKLESIYVNGCKLMEVVVVTEVERPTMMLFPVLHHLYLEDLPKLATFCNLTSNLIDLSSLSKLWIKNCPTMKTFISNSLHANMTASTECCTMNSKENLEADIQPFFDEKVRLSSLKELIIEQMDNLKKVWHNQLYPDSFYKLQRLRVVGCNKLFNVFPSNMPGRLRSLEVLLVMECDSVEEIFELKALDSKKTHDFAAAQLKTLRLCNLPKLKQVWNMDSQVILSFQNLHSLSIHNCDSMKSLFPAIIARGLEQLEKLYVHDCMMEEIIAKEDEVQAVPEFVFPQLTELRLVNLPRLKSIHLGLYISKWPMLERLLVWRCNEVEKLASNFQSQEESQHDIPSGQPLFLVDKIAFPSLNRLALNWNCLVNEISYGKFSEYSCNLNDLQLFGPFMESVICPSCFLCKLPKVTSLAIYNGCFKELFLCEGLVCKENHFELPSGLSLLLCELSDSLLWEAYSEFNKVAQNLATLQVSYCKNIRSLVSSTMSFRNLTTLEVSNCGELLNLVASSTAKSLVQLTRLEITECQKMEEIITHKEDEAEGSIIFNQLKYLGLNNLPSLTIFYSGSCTIEFPSLQEVAVRQCPNMKIFSQGNLSTPRLHTLQMAETEKGGCWEGDLNTTIEQQYIEKNEQCAKEG